MSDDLSGFSLMELFRTEAEGQTAALSEGLLALEGSAATPAALETLMRAAHSLKGAARIVGLDAAVRVAHALEDCFVAAQRGKIAIRPAHVDVLLGAVDILAELSQVAEGEAAGWASAHAGRLDAMVSALGTIQAGHEPEAGPPPDEVEAPDPSTPPESPPPVPTLPRDEGGSQDATIEASSSLSSLAGEGSERIARPEPPPEEPGPAPSPPAAPEAADRMVRVTADSLTRLMGLAGESLVEARRLRPFLDSFRALKGRQDALWEALQDLERRWDARNGSGPPGRDRDALARARDDAGRCRFELGTRLDEFEDLARRNEDLSGRLHHEVIASRLRPLADGIRGFPRLVRDVARQLGKEVRFDVRGERTGVDRDILEKLEAPLNHLIRNALDHGLEAPDDRKHAGKPASGTIRLEARHRSGMLQIVLADDGRGIDLAKLRASIVAKGLSTEAMAAEMTEAELLEFLFLPGFSTKAAVTDLSGRGVGLDVVRSMVQAVGGNVRVHSRKGEGTTFTLLLPITMSVIRALLVNVGGEPYAFPLARIERIEQVPMGEVQALEGRQHVRIDGQPVGLVSATQVLELPGETNSPEILQVVVVADRGQRFGLVVDGFLGERDLQVRPLDPRLGKVPDISSASVLEDGRPVLIVDVEDLVRSIDNLLGGRRLRRLAAEDAGPRRRAAKRVLVVDDSITVRELERQLLEARGFAVDTAVDGMDGWNAVRGGTYQLVVSDVDMPRLDGIQLVRQIKQDPALKALPVVIVSYKDREEDRLRGLDAGATCYLTKSSFHDRTFLDAIVDLIGDPLE